MTFTVNEFWIFLTVAVGVIGIVITVLTLIGKWRDIKKPRQEKQITYIEMINQHDRMLKKDNERLNRLEQYDSVLLSAILAMVNHEIDGNGIEKLKISRDELTNAIIKLK